MELELFIHAQWNRYNKNYSYSAASSDMSDYGYIFLHKVSVPITTPTELELRRLTEKALRQKATAIRAKAYQEVSEIEEEIQEMLSLEFKPALEPEEQHREGTSNPAGADDGLPF